MREDANKKKDKEKTMKTVKRKKRENSWLLVVLLMLFTSLVIAVSGIYVADKLWKMSLNEEYNCYIRKIEEYKQESGLRYNDGVYRSEIRNVLSEYEVTENMMLENMISGSSAHEAWN